MLILQLAALVGSAAAYIRMRTQAERVVMQKDLSRERCEGLEDALKRQTERITKLEHAQSVQERGIAEDATQARNAVVIARRAEERAEQAHAAAVSARNSAAALKRYQPKPPADETEEETENAEQIEAFPELPHMIPGPRKGELPAGFGAMPR